MKEVLLPVLLLDKDCVKCAEIDIESENRARLYADDECVEQDIIIKCKNVYRCEKLLKRLREK